MPAKVYSDKDADLGVLKNKTLAVLGFGSQGHAHALNLKDSGLTVIIGLYEGSKSIAVAREKGFEVVPTAEAVKRADVIMVALPDTTQAAAYAKDIAPNLTKGKTLLFSHGFAIHFKTVVVPKNVNVIMVAPKGPGHIVRRQYTEGKGVPALIAVHQGGSAAKKVALALQNLIKAQYPKDSLYIIGFSAYARELKPQELPYVRWDESVLGTNMHHALMLAERMLAKHRVGTKQILMISDGEPTAHLENGRSQFAYPPSPITIRETLKAVKRVTQQNITINTFMLDRNYYLKEFVNQLAKINGGRVFYTTPDRLGEYILVDYVQHKRKHIAQR